MIAGHQSAQFLYWSCLLNILISVPFISALKNKNTFHVSGGCDWAFTLGSLLRIVLCFIRNGKPHGKSLCHLIDFYKFTNNEVKEELCFFKR